MRSTLIVMALTVLTVGMVAPPSEAQINTRRARERAEQQARDRAARRADQGVDKAVEAAENAVVCAVTDADCIQKAKAEGKDVSVTDASGKQVLVAEHGIDASRLESKGLGASKPASSNDTPEGRQNNRRVELVKI